MELSAGLLASIGAGLLFLFATFLLAQEASRDDLQRRIRSVTRPGSGTVAKLRLRSGLLGVISRLGGGLASSAFLSPRDIEELERLVRAAGHSPRHAASTVIGIKVLLVLLCPLLALAYGTLHDYAPLHRSVMAMLAAVFGLMVPNWAMRMARARYAKSLRLGLPDALDLLVISAEAGLGLESALNRVATELRGSHSAVSVEFSLLVQEMRLLPDRQTALQRMGERTGIEALQRLGSTLAQTLRFGTPLGEALRVLAAEMRTERMIRIEEQALRLPALLTLPLILFILPCLFIVLAGPSLIQFVEVMGH